MAIIKNNLSVLTFAGKRLAFHLQEVAGIVRAAQLIPNNDNIPFVLGNIVYAGQQWPVFSLDAQFALMTDYSTSYAYGIGITANHGHTGLVLLAETITNVVLETELKLIPKCAKVINSPLQYWCWYDDNLLSIIDTAALALYITYKIEKFNV